ncbi:MAG: shikimate kinase [Pseudomonadota bacterium]
MGSQNKDPDLDHPTDEDALFEARILGKSIVLVGMMGVGKTTIGRRLAPKVGLPFRDADEEIERAAGMSVSDLFEKHGEPSFRRGETQVIERLLSGPPIVLATGGGAMTIEATRHVIKEKSVSVWLSADADTITTRARRRDTRPLLRTDNPRKTIETLMSEREQFYRQADLRVDSASGPHTKTVERLVEALQGFVRKDTPR